MDFVELKRGFASFAGSVKELVGIDVNACMQCAKCSAGCPVAFAMDVLPHQIIRLCMLGAEKPVLSSKTIWICASCQTCTTRCPADIDIAGVMDALRKIARERGVVAGKSVEKFVRNFMKTVEEHGRVFELELTLRYNLATGNPLKDAAFGPR
ncbi:MAG TPA: heterodisulfide reductase subunit C, partial [Proteobacteria bacterium]|nr:heterodisulfide reductase subunit C [Pseudomonadota bacterium]